MLLASVLDNGDAAVLAAGDGVVDAGSVHALLDQLMTHAPAGEVRVRIVTTPDRPALDDARWAVRAFSAAGYPVDAVVVTRVPMPGDGWPKAWAGAERSRVATFASSCPVPVVTMRLRPRRRVVARRMPALAPRALPVAGVPAATASGYTWRVPVDAIADVAELRIGQDGDRLVIGLDATTVRREPPAVLARCMAIAAREVEDGIEVDFVRDPELWPAGAA